MPVSIDRLGQIRRECEREAKLYDKVDCVSDRIEREGELSDETREDIIASIQSCASGEKYQLKPEAELRRMDTRRLLRELYIAEARQH